MGSLTRIDPNMRRILPLTLLLGLTFLLGISSAFTPDLENVKQILNDPSFDTTQLKTRFEEITGKKLDQEMGVENLLDELTIFLDKASKLTENVEKEDDRIVTTERSRFRRAVTTPDYNTCVSDCLAANLNDTTIDCDANCAYITSTTP